MASPFLDGPCAGQSVAYLPGRVEGWRGEPASVVWVCRPVPGWQVLPGPFYEYVWRGTGYVWSGRRSDDVGPGSPAE